MNSTLLTVLLVAAAVAALGFLHVFPAYVVVVLFVIAWAAWNFLPDVRKQMRGWSTMIEASAGSLLVAAGTFADALHDLITSGYLPEWAAGQQWIIVLAWILLKRKQTTTPLGKLL